MDKTTRRVLVAAFSAALTLCLAMMYDGYKTESAGEQIYARAAQAFVSVRPPEAVPEPALASAEPALASTEPEDISPVQTLPRQEEAGTSAAPAPAVIADVSEVAIDFDGLLAVNSEVVGWIIIENTTVSYPVLQGGDNEKYLIAAYNGKYSKNGSIFVDYRLKSDFSGRNTVVYGHNMRNSSMFGVLTRFTEQDFWRERRFFHIVLPDGSVNKYEIFAAYKADIGSETFIVGFSDREHYAGVLRKMLELSSIDTGVQPGTDDKIVTLCTCTSDTAESETRRNVVIGRLVLE